MKPKEQIIDEVTDMAAERAEYHAKLDAMRSKAAAERALHLDDERERAVKRATAEAARAAVGTLGERPWTDRRRARR